VLGFAVLRSRRKGFSRTMRKATYMLSVLLLLTLIVACTKKRDDNKIATDIQAKVSTDPVTQGSQVYVESKQGKVTLKGRAKSQQAQLRVQKIAREEPGVASVEDETVVIPEKPAPAAKPVALPLPPPPPPKPIVVPSGTVLTIRTDQPLGSKESQAGATFSGSLVTPITIEGKAAIPAGVPVAGVVQASKKAGRFKGGASLVLALHSVTVYGHSYNIETELLAQETTGKGKRTAASVGGGTGAGAVIGGIAGGGKGAAIGAVAGAGAGLVGAATGNRDIKLPAESALSFKLIQPLTLKPEA
jgi:hypothetical protein